MQNVLFIFSIQTYYTASYMCEKTPRNLFLLYLSFVFYIYTSCIVCVFCACVMLLGWLMYDVRGGAYIAAVVMVIQKLKIFKITKQTNEQKKKHLNKQWNILHAHASYKNYMYFTCLNNIICIRTCVRRGGGGRTCYIFLQKINFTSAEAAATSSS